MLDTLSPETDTTPYSGLSTDEMHALIGTAPETVTEVVAVDAPPPEDPPAPKRRAKVIDVADENTDEFAEFSTADLENHFDFLVRYNMAVPVDLIAVLEKRGVYVRN